MLSQPMCSCKLWLLFQLGSPCCQRTLVWDELIEVPSREIQAPLNFPPSRSLGERCLEKQRNLSQQSRCSNRRHLTCLRGKMFLPHQTAKDRIPSCIPALISSIYTCRKPAPPSLLITTAKENQVKYFRVTLV